MAPAPSPVSVTPQRLAEITAEWFRSGAQDAHLASRLASADTTLHLHFGDGAGATIHLDRTPLQAEPQIVGTAEVEMHLTPEQMVGLIRRERQMAMSILDGDIEVHGPVRKFLRVVPILRSLDYSMWREVA